MNAEQISLTTRAGIHAALSEPRRLAIVDALCLGDLSPTELQHDLGIASNLLAHHLRVLEGAGLVTRSRSESDRRRTYLRLDRTHVGNLFPGSTEHARRIVFVCTANSARSHLAAALWKDASAVPATSAGTHPAAGVAPGALAVAKRHRLSMPQTQPRALGAVLTSEDFVVTVCDQAHEELSGVASLHWSVPDPAPIGTTAAFEAAFADLQERVADVAPRLIAS